MTTEMSKINVSTSARWRICSMEPRIFVEFRCVCVCVRVSVHGFLDVWACTQYVNYDLWRVYFFLARWTKANGKTIEQTIRNDKQNYTHKHWHINNWTKIPRQLHLLGHIHKSLTSATIERKPSNGAFHQDSKWLWVWLGVVVVVVTENLQQMDHIRFKRNCFMRALFCLSQTRHAHFFSFFVCSLHTHTDTHSNVGHEQQYKLCITFLRLDLCVLPRSAVAIEEFPEQYLVFNYICFFFAFCFSLLIPCASESNNNRWRTKSLLTTFKPKRREFAVYSLRINFMCQMVFWKHVAWNMHVRRPIIILMLYVLD